MSTTSVLFLLLLSILFSLSPFASFISLSQWHFFLSLFLFDAWACLTGPLSIFFYIFISLFLYLCLSFFSLSVCQSLSLSPFSHFSTFLFLPFYFLAILFLFFFLSLSFNPLCYLLMFSHNLLFMFYLFLASFLVKVHLHISETIDRVQNFLL